jgi:NTE family protein
MEAWKRDDRSNLYDYRIIRRRHDELVDVRASGDAQRLLYYLNEGVHGNMGGMGTPALYTKARSGTKNLISSYVQELVAAIDDFERIDESEIDYREKLACLRRATGCFGRSALMLSGAGSLGAFHIGVAKALVEQDILPDVISGASAGSVVAAILGTYRDRDLVARLSSDSAISPVDALAETSVSRVQTKSRRLIGRDDLVQMIEVVVPDMTFLDAYEETGRSINISVAPAKLHQRSRMLNAITSPNAFIREAILASCAIPGVFPAVTLAGRNSAGKRVPYVPSRQWVDGSITDDLPSRRLARMYSVNHFITSQTNPMVLWALRDPHADTDLLSRAFNIQQRAFRDWLRAIYPFVADTVRDLPPMNTQLRFWFSLLTQEYTADINIIPKRRFVDPTTLLANLTTEQASDLISDGEHATWPKIEMIRNCTAVSRGLSRILRRMEARGLGVVPSPVTTDRDGTPRSDPPESAEPDQIPLLETRPPQALDATGPSADTSLH